MIYAEVVYPPTTVQLAAGAGFVASAGVDRSEKKYRRLDRDGVSGTRVVAFDARSRAPRRARNVRASVQVARVVVERRRIDLLPCNDTRAAAAATFDVRLSAATTLSAERFMEV